MAWGHRMKGFQLQRKVEDVEIAICGFFDGERFIDQVNFEHHFRDLLYNSSKAVATQTEITAA
jgi:phosphoribosylamine--glycine ligase